MRPSNWIKRYIAALNDGDVFTTRCFMGFGSRAAIDQCLYRMVKEGRVIRLARGVFAKNEVPAKITLYDMAKIKAHAFGKSIYEHGITTAAEMGLLENPEPVFATDGCSSSFGTFLGRVHVKSVSAKKREFGTPGHDSLRRTLKGLWYLGKRLCSKGVIQKYLQQFNNRKGDEVLAEEAATLPYWLIEKFPFRPHLAITASQRRNSVARLNTPASRAPRDPLSPASGNLAAQSPANPALAAPAANFTSQLQHLVPQGLDFRQEQNTLFTAEQTTVQPLAPNAQPEPNEPNEPIEPIEPIVTQSLSKSAQKPTHKFDKIPWFEPVVSAFELPIKPQDGSVGPAGNDADSEVREAFGAGTFVHDESCSFNEPYNGIKASESQNWYHRAVAPSYKIRLRIA